MDRAFEDALAGLGTQHEIAGLPEIGASITYLDRVQMPGAAQIGARHRLGAWVAGKQNHARNDPNTFGNDMRQQRFELTLGQMSFFVRTHH